MAPHLYPSHCQILVTLEHDLSILAAAHLIKQLGHTVPTYPSVKLMHLTALQQLTAIMAGQPNVPPTIATPPREGATASPRVGAPAPPPRVPLFQIVLHH
jgi:hypothetical protein